MSRSGETETGHRSIPECLLSNACLPRGMCATGSFHKFARFEVTGANFYAMNGAVFVYYANCLKIRFPPALGNTGDILTDTAFAFCFTATDNAIADLGAFAAIFTYS
jgi:hypothetical protein